MRLILGLLVLAAIGVYALICKVWPPFESFGFPCVIAAVFAALHGLYWHSNRGQRFGWSILKTRAVYIVTLLFIEGIALGIYAGMSQGQSTN